MPLVRFVRWPYLSPLAPYTAYCNSGRTYRWSNADQGVTEVPYKADVEELLNPYDAGPSLFEIAWERYFVFFDAAGREIPPASPETVAPTPVNDEGPPERPKSKRLPVSQRRA